MRPISGTKARGIRIRTKRGNKVCAYIYIPISNNCTCFRNLNRVEMEDGQTCLLQVYCTCLLVIIAHA
jgi:hypothetical protein